ncbi:MAG: hypothetical protein B6245_08795 [Desulfobacteraceae bacterium 4572_88]|nr:MAG: hypothetical protein B6245_08795 [Desulfobacteraceae bacterium 4572_88]
MLPLNKIFFYPPIIQIAYFLLCFVIAGAGWNKRMGFWGYLFASILFSPLIGLMLLIVSEKNKK